MSTASSDGGEMGAFPPLCVEILTPAGAALLSDDPAAFSGAIFSIRFVVLTLSFQSRPPRDAAGASADAHP